ncbi:hypothetical protein [Kribbella monticola]|uniref:hypothetical protein n=1 Tax=Kribbella monticola TaxID=2185285 RepID=UPI000DD49DEE|nr:hypothetical protein [Kribbella monticola]
MRLRFLALAATAAVITTGFTGPAQAATGSCVEWPLAPGEPYTVFPELADKALQLPVAVRRLDYTTDCTGLTALVEKTDGTLKTTVALDKNGETGGTEPPQDSRYGLLTVPLANGAGDWKIVSLSQGTQTRTLNQPLFHVYRKALVTLEQPARTSGTAKTSLTGLLRRYNAQGVLVPMVGATARIIRDGGAVIGTAKTDSTGRYRLSLSFNQNTEIWAELYETNPGYYPESPSLWVHKLIAMSYLNYSATAKVGALWKVSGTAFPGRLDTALQIYTGTAWVAAGSAGPTAADGSYARYWKPGRTGSFRLRVVVSGPGLDNSPWNREAVVTVS